MSKIELNKETKKSLTFGGKFALFIATMVGLLIMGKGCTRDKLSPPPDKLVKLKILYTNGKPDTLNVAVSDVRMLELSDWSDLTADHKVVADNVKSFSIISYDSINRK